LWLIRHSYPLTTSDETNHHSNHDKSHNDETNTQHTDFKIKYTFLSGYQYFKAIKNTNEFLIRDIQQFFKNDLWSWDDNIYKYTGHDSTDYQGMSYTFFNSHLDDSHEGFILWATVGNMKRNSNDFSSVDETLLKGFWFHCGMFAYNNVGISASRNIPVVNKQNMLPIAGVLRSHADYELTAETTSIWGIQGANFLNSAIGNAATLRAWLNRPTKASIPAHNNAFFASFYTAIENAYHLKKMTLHEVLTVKHGGTHTGSTGISGVVPIRGISPVVFYNNGYDIECTYDFTKASSIPMLLPFEEAKMFVNWINNVENLNSLTMTNIPPYIVWITRGHHSDYHRKGGTQTPMDTDMYLGAYDLNFTTGKYTLDTQMWHCEFNTNTGGYHQGYKFKALPLKKL